MVAATATSTTEKRSKTPTRAVGVAACDLVVGTAIVITPLAAGAVIGRMVDAYRGPSFIPTVRSAPEWAYAFTGSCAVGRSRALPPIRELHPCPEDHQKIISSLSGRRRVAGRAPAGLRRPP